MRSSALYPGSFDPFTRGHEDIARRAAGIFDRLVIAVAANSSKKPIFDVQQRVELARGVLADLENIEVVSYSGLTVEFARGRGLPVIVRGLRAVSDFELEFQLANMGRHLEPGIETVFLVPKEQYTFISSTLVREIATLGGDVSHFVHPLVEAAFRRRLAGEPDQ
jgi:pantetheine-phosphate adenylyltransferase